MYLLVFFVQIPDILEMIKPKLEIIGFKNVSCIAGKAERLNSVAFPFFHIPSANKQNQLLHSFITKIQFTIKI